jgi:5-methylcytosine-specific restriction enzyme subunit McrC
LRTGSPAAREEEDSLMTIRGRLRFDEQLRRHFGQAPPAEVRYDEYTEDIELNRNVKSALCRLVRLRIRRAHVRRSLVQLDFALERVSDIEYPPHAVPEVYEAE